MEEVLVLVGLVALSLILTREIRSFRGVLVFAAAVLVAAIPAGRSARHGPG